MTTQGYIEVNRGVYDATAQEFQAKKELRHEGTVAFVGAFTTALVAAHGSRVLELGPGSGYAANLLDEAGYDVTAIEFSKPMADLAQQTAPNVHFIVDEFLRHDFKGERFDGIMGIAFLHLFPEQEASKVVAKIHQLLEPGGLAMLSTTKHEAVSEGYAQKTNFSNSGQRFRRCYTPQAFQALLEDNNFRIQDYTESTDREVDSKVWMTVVATAAIESE